MFRRVIPGLRVRHHVRPVTVGARVALSSIWGLNGESPYVVRTPTKVLGIDPLRSAVQVTVVGLAGAYLAGSADDATNGLGALVKPGALPWSPSNPTAELWAIPEYPFMDAAALVVNPTLNLLPTITVALLSEVQQLCQ